MLAESRQRFLADYVRIRHAEGRGSPDASYYLELPYRDITGRLHDQWTMRARTYRYLENRVLPPIEKAFGRRLRITDLGAGNCWMSYRLALRGHSVAAMDILTDSLDGLGAGAHYEGVARFSRINAEFDHLPLADGSVDLILYNASIHYSTDYHRTLAEARRCLGPGGWVVVADTPVYRKREHGEMMRRERHQQFFETYGFASDSLPSLEYFDEGALRELSRDLRMVWTVHKPWYGWRWALRPWRARWHGTRPPSRFWILAGRFA